MKNKIIASVLAITFAVSMVGVGNTAEATTLEELQAMFDDLMGLNTIFF